MNSRTLLLASAAAFAPMSPLAAQQVGAQPSGATSTTASTAAQPDPSQQSAVSPAVASAPSPPQPGTTTPAANPNAPALDDTGDEEDAIVITGQKPRGSVIGDIPAENTLDARDVRATGATNINDLLEALAPQIGSVRGRGGEAPVLLLNGERISSFRELRDIPTEAIVRVEILPEEVALKYGYGADQKVVNIVLRQRFRSTTAQVGVGAATEGGYANANADLTRLLIQRNGRTTINLHAEGNSMLT
ncbi:MAG TPA: TonB-dependent receptor plug domain-containing protein, partial [Gemmatimonadaceae bacterium]|nr:TonB-dependent receptor plug domain-containing protein [Gemmatimonadaceae bacterium]